MTITSTTVSSGNTTNDASINLTFTASEKINSFSKTDVLVTDGSLSALTSDDQIVLLVNLHQVVMVNVQ